MTRPAASVPIVRAAPVGVVTDEASSSSSRPMAYEPVAPGGVQDEIWPARPVGANVWVRADGSRREISSPSSSRP